MADREPTPEEQLLRLIEKSDAAQKPTGAEPSVAVKKDAGSKTGVSFFNFNKWKAVFSYFKSAQKEKAVAVAPGAALTLDIRIINNLLLASVLAMAVYLVIDLFFFKSDPQSFLSQVSTADAVYPVVSEENALEVKDLNYYKDVLNKRNPFLPAGAQVAEPVEQGAPVPAPTTAKMTDVLQALKLVGISWSGNEPLAMIEDAKSGRTYFLREGQEINEVKVQTIKKEKVIVTYQGEEGALY